MSLHRWSIRSTEQLERTVTPLSALHSYWALVAVTPLALTIGIIGAVFAVTSGTGLPEIPQFATLVYGIANVIVVLGLYVRLREQIWLTGALVRPPTRTELSGGILATITGVLIGWPLTTVLADSSGVARYTVTTLTSPAGTVIVFCTAVVVAPIAEEILFRGFLLGILLERGYSPVRAGLSSILVFATIHIFTAGIAGVINAFLLGLLLTWLRLSFDNLVGAWLMHLLNNLLEFLIGVSLLPSLYAL